MARDFIKLDRTNASAIMVSQLQSLVEYLRQAYDQGKKVKARMDHCTDGTVWTDLETFYGVPTGSGQTVYNLVSGFVGTMEGTATSADGKNLTERVG